MKVLLDVFCPLQQHSNPLHSAAGIWPDFRLETNLLGWRQRVGRCWEITFQSDRFQCSRWHISNVDQMYFLVWSLSRLLCFVGSGPNVAAALAIKVLHIMKYTDYMLRDTRNYQLSRTKIFLLFFVTTTTTGRSVTSRVPTELIQINESNVTTPWEYRTPQVELPRI
jgi:hypothetical protein